LGNFTVLGLEIHSFSHCLKLEKKERIPVEQAESEYVLKEAPLFKKNLSFWPAPDISSSHLQKSYVEYYAHYVAKCSILITQTPHNIHDSAMA
jgi:hypothetical protein